MSTYRIGDATLNLEVVGAGIRLGRLPKGRPELRGYLDDFTPSERRDLEAFEAAGWRFLRGEDLNWHQVQEGNSDRKIMPGLLAKRPGGGLVIIRNRLTAQFAPGWREGKIKERLKRYSGFRDLQLFENLFEIELKVPASDLRDAIQRELDDLLSKTYSGEVMFAEPSLLYYVEPTGYVRPAEPFYQWQWDLVELEDAWKTAGRMGGGVQVAVVDRGFYYSDPEIQSATAWRAGLDDRGELIPLESMPTGDHGTFCAGLIGARLNRMDVNGAAPKCDLILVTIPRHGVISQDVLAKALMLCADPSVFGLGYRGADVISCSLGPSEGNWELGCTLRKAIDFANANGRTRREGSLGTPVIWATFNADKEIAPTSVEGYERVISVSQCDISSCRVSSGYGLSLDLVAPGYGVLGIQWDFTGRVIDYGYGSSLAAPCVAGVAALVLSVNFDLTSEQVATVLTRSCDPPANTKVPNEDTGWGRLNAKKAIDLAKSLTAPAPHPPGPPPPAPPAPPL